MPDHPAVMRKVCAPHNRRRILSIGDQGVSSVTNVLVAVLVARSFDSPAPFGAFGLAMIVCQLLVGMNQAVVGDTFLSIYSDEPLDARRRLLPDMLGTTVILAIASSVVLAAVGILLGGLPGSALLGASFIALPILVHSTWRYFFIVDRPGLALLIDIVWLLGVLGSWFVAPSNVGVSWFVVAWGIGAALGVLVALVVGDGLVAKPNPVRWVSEHRRFCGDLLGEFFTSQAIGRVVAGLLAPIAGLNALASVRASELYFGPHFTLFGGIRIALVPEGVRNRKEPERLRRMMTKASIVLASTAAIWLLAGLLAPTSWGEALLNENWEGARDLILPFGVGVVATGFVCGGRIGLRSLGDSRRLLTTRLHVTPWQVVLPLSGALLGGAVGFGVGFALSRIATAGVYWRAFAKALDETQRKLNASGAEASMLDISPLETR